MAVPAPASLETSDLEFKLQCRIKIFDNASCEEFKKPCSLVATASRFGLVFVGTTAKNFQVIQIEEIESLEKEVSVYPRRVVELPSSPTHLSINCDCTKLSVVVEKFGSPTAIFYDVLSFLKQEVVIIKEIRLSATPNVDIMDTDWNPALPEIFTACKSDGSLGVYEFKGSALDIHEVPSAAGVTCFCWSPRGKQIAVGSRDGKITQYKPDLKAVKAVGAPPLDGSPPIIALKWASSFQFIGIYKAADPEAQAFLIVVDAPKTGGPVYTNYEDVCYSYGAARPSQFYMILEQHWNILMVASSNSMEVGVVACETDKWIQWLLGDSCRAELPLSQSKQDTLPVGVSLHTGTTKSLGVGDNRRPPSPLLLLLSHQGLLCCFYAVNSKAGAPSVCSPPEPIADKSGVNLFVRAQPKQVSIAAPTAVPPQSTAPTQPPPVQLPPPVTSSQLPFVPIQFSVSSFLPPKPPQPPAVIAPARQSPFGSTNQSSPFVALTPKQNQSREILKATKTVSFAPLLEEHTAPNTGSAETINKEGPEMLPQKTTDGRIPIHKDTEAMIAKLIREECITLESELRALLHKGRELKVNIGADSEAAQMVQQTNNLEEFVKALHETSTSQASEIHTLKQNLIQTWGWFEEARSRHNSSKDPVLLALLQVKPLDPASQRQSEEISHLTYYLDSQLWQANQSLDEQWENFQDSLSKNMKVQVSTMEAIYQAMIKQNSTLQKQRYILKDVSSRIKTHNRNKPSNILISLDKVEDLEEELTKLQLYPDGVPQVEYNRIFERQKKFTQGKAQKLFKFLSKRNVTNVTISKPELNNSTVLLTTLLSAPLSPIAPDKKIQPIKLDFNNVPAKPADKFPPAKQDKMFGMTSTPIVKTTKLENIDPKPVTFRNPNAVSQPLLQTPISAAVIKFDPPKSTFNPTSSFIPFSFSTTTAASALNVATAASLLSQPTTAKVASSSIASSNKPVSVFGSSTTPPVVSSKAIFGNVSSSTAVKVVDGGKKSGFSFAAATEAGADPPKPSVSNSALFAALSSVGTTASTASLFGGVKSSTQTFSFGTTVASADTSTKSFVPATQTPPIFVSTPVKPLATTAMPTFFSGALSSTTSATIIKPTTVVGSLSSSVAATTASATTAVTTTSVPKSAATCVVLITPSFTPTISLPTTITTGSPATAVTTTPSVVLTVPSVTSTTSARDVPSAGVSVTPIFGAPTTPSPSAILVTAPSTTSVFSTPTSTPVFDVNPPMSSPLFGAPVATMTTTQSLPFTTTGATSGTGNLATIAESVPVTQASVFTSVPTAAIQSSIFGGSSATTQGSIFGGSTSTTQGSIFGGSTATTTESSIFSESAATTTQSSIFGGTTNLPSATSQGIFGGSTNAPVMTTQSTIFGGSTQGSIFGGSTNTSGTTSQASVFGGSTVAATQKSVFGGSSFNSVPAAAATQPSIFGGGNQTGFTTTTSSVFGPRNVFGTQVTAAAPAFGPSSPFATSAQSPFGGALSRPAPTNSGSLFGQSSNFGGASVFGGTPGTTTASNVFGDTSTGSFGSNANAFGPATTTSSPFDGGSVFAPASTASSPFGATPSPSSPFGQAANAFGDSPASFGTFEEGNTASVGFNSLNVGATTTTSGSFGPFGEAAPNPFARSSAQEQKPAFSGGGFFGAPTTTAAPSIFGGSTPFNKPATSAFGSAPSFGSPNAFGTQPTAFGGQPTTFGGSFGSPGQGTFSGGQQGGFGTSPAFQKPSAAFGSPAVFGTQSAGFGSSPSFGGAATFGGGNASFGSPQKVFGAPATDQSFGSVPQNSTFGNLANQNTLGFGNLAQQAGSPSQPSGFSGSSSFSSWR